MLGTAMWAWTIEKNHCFNLLDHFYEQGYRQVDCATNYPIDKNPQHFRMAESLLLEWIQTHQIKDLKVNMKIGSLNNLKTPDHNLSKSFLIMNLQDYLNKFQENLDCFMVHWDNRKQDAQIRETFEAFQIIKEQHLAIGLSGIKSPEIYSTINQEFKFDFNIQIKHNIIKSDFHRYPDFHGRRCFYTYGINAGGVKLNTDTYHDQSSLVVRGVKTETIKHWSQELSLALKRANENNSRPPLITMNQLGMIFSYYSPDINGILLGPSKLDQLKESIDFYNILNENDYLDVFNDLERLSNPN